VVRKCFAFAVSMGLIGGGLWAAYVLFFETARFRLVLAFAAGFVVLLGVCLLCGTLRDLLRERANNERVR
jgi:hypothetical protein